MKKYLNNLFDFIKHNPVDAVLVFIAGWCIGLIIQ